MGIIGAKRKEENMKKIVTPILMILCAAIFIGAMPTDAEGAIYKDTVRLHILANSDSEEDQMLKLALRDAILNEYGCELSAFENVEDAKRELEARICEIEDFANEKLSALGSSYTCRASIGEEWYDTREYDNFTLPKGVYTSLKIVIGEGEGKNWWCVMFPPLCLDAAVSAPSYSDAEELLIKKKYKVKFKILELVSEIFG